LVLENDSLYQIEHIEKNTLESIAVVTEGVAQRRPEQYKRIIGTAGAMFALLLGEISCLAKGSGSRATGRKFGFAENTGRSLLEKTWAKC